MCGRDTQEKNMGVWEEHLLKCSECLLVQEEEERETDGKCPRYTVASASL